jgi:hypothetical protein
VLAELVFLGAHLAVGPRKEDFAFRRFERLFKEWHEPVELVQLAKQPLRKATPRLATAP